MDLDRLKGLKANTTGSLSQTSPEGGGEMALSGRFENGPLTINHNLLNSMLVYWQQSLWPVTWLSGMVGSGGGWRRGWRG